MTIIDLGLIDYGKAYDLQKEYVATVAKQGGAFLLLCEHPRVITLGRLADEGNIFDKGSLEKSGFKIFPVNRGGDVTLHAPGQLVAYPIIDLNDSGRDLHRYMHHLEQVAIDLLGDFDILASRLKGKTGVWVGSRKIASLGIGVRQWITFHGLALNVNTDLNLFNHIRPCGMDIEMISIERIKGYPVNIAKVKEVFIDRFCQIFNFKH